MWCHCTCLFSFRYRLGGGGGHVVCEVIGGRGCLLYTSFHFLSKNIKLTQIATRDFSRFSAFFCPFPQAPSQQFKTINLLKESVSFFICIKKNRKLSVVNTR